MAGDFYLSYASDELWLHPWERKYPLEKIQTVYKLYGKPNVTMESLEVCKALFDLGLWAEEVFGRFLYIYQSSFHDFVPFVGEHVLECPSGGIDNMAVWATWVWERIGRWIDNGAPAHPQPHSSNAQPTPGEDYVYGRLHGRPLKLSRSDAWVHSFTGALEPLREQAYDLMRTNALNSNMFELVDPNDRTAGVYFKGPSQHLKVAQHVLDILASTLVEGGVLDAEAPQHLRLVLPTVSQKRETGKVTAFGKSRNDDQDQAILMTNTGSTRTESINSSGRVQLMQGFGPDDASPLAYQGRSLAVGDFNNDSIPDVAVSSYGWGVAGRPQVGRVTVQYGSNSRIEETSGGTRTSTGNESSTTVLEGEMANARFGWDIVSLDFNSDGIDDLCVSAPTASWGDTLPVSDETPAMRFWGRVSCFFGGAGPASSLTTSPNVTIETTADLTGLGLVLRSLDLNGDGTKDLVVGAPMNSNTTNHSARADNIQRGLVLGFLSGPQRISGTVLTPARDTADLHIDGPSNFEWFGAEIALLESAAVSTPTLGQEVRKHENSVGLNRNASRLLLVGAPSHRTSNGSVGRLYAFDLMGKHSLPNQMVQTLAAASNSVSTPNLAFTISGIEHAAEFGKSVVVMDGVTVGTSAPQQVVVVASPAAGNVRSGVHLQAGEVRVISASALLNAAINMTSSKITAGSGSVPDFTVDELGPQAVTFVGGGNGSMLGRLGYSMLAADVLPPLDGVPDLIMAAPFVCDDEQLLIHAETGAIFAFDGASLPDFGTSVEDVVHAKGSQHVWGTERHGRFGFALEMIPSANASGSPQLMVASPMESTNVTEMGGTVRTVNF